MIKVVIADDHPFIREGVKKNSQQQNEFESDR